MHWLYLKPRPGGFSAASQGAPTVQPLTTTRMMSAVFWGVPRRPWPEEQQLGTSVFVLETVIGRAFDRASGPCAGPLLSRSAGGCPSRSPLPLVVLPPVQTPREGADATLNRYAPSCGPAYADGASATNGCCPRGSLGGGRLSPLQRPLAEGGSYSSRVGPALQAATEPSDLPRDEFKLPNLEMCRALLYVLSALSPISARTQRVQ